MLDLGWTELLVIGILTILIFGPKELPVVFRTVTQWLGKARSVAREFQRTVDDMARETELDEIRKAAKNAASEMNTMVDPTGSMDGLFDDPDKPKSKPNSASQPQSMPDTPRPDTPREPSGVNDAPAVGSTSTVAETPATAEPEKAPTPEQKGGQA
ncbi:MULTISPECIES: Sec-independent protein translocase protein TatB [unclassified Minwuia]|jgi:sec-independent protein translocase protein TatB|uniref:Sec-independent protein translocase protein TatB n=1 Tax=unclassified Minwuia TaxID=2618799 RepID=UPI002478A016|nr:MULTISPECIES: Sec-independent protein translocase protein TatB [unclassified Minwuia]